jgi:hypothetical protein
MRSLGMSEQQIEQVWVGSGRSACGIRTSDEFR